MQLHARQGGRACVTWLDPTAAVLDQGWCIPFRGHLPLLPPALPVLPARRERPRKDVPRAAPPAGAQRRRWVGRRVTGRAAARPNPA